MVFMVFMVFMTFMSALNLASERPDEIQLPDSDLPDGTRQVVGADKGDRDSKVRGREIPWKNVRARA
jgi:hypothetical protein